MILVLDFHVLADTELTQVSSKRIPSDIYSAAVLCHLWYIRKMLLTPLRAAIRLLGLTTLYTVLVIVPMLYDELCVGLR